MALKAYPITCWCIALISGWLISPTNQCSLNNQPTSIESLRSPLSPDSDLTGLQQIVSTVEGHMLWMRIPRVGWHYSSSIRDIFVFFLTCFLCFPPFGSQLRFQPIHYSQPEINSTIQDLTPLPSAPGCKCQTHPPGHERHATEGGNCS